MQFVVILSTIFTLIAVGVDAAAIERSGYVSTPFYLVPKFTTAVPTPLLTCLQNDGTIGIQSKNCGLFTLRDSFIGSGPEFITTMSSAYGPCLVATAADSKGQISSDLTCASDYDEATAFVEVNSEEYGHVLVIKVTPESDETEIWSSAAVDKGNPFAGDVEEFPFVLEIIRTLVATF